MAGDGVGQGAVGPGRHDDGEGRPLGAVRAHQILQHPGDFGFGHTGADRGPQFFKSALGAGHRPTRSGDFLCVLARPLVFDNGFERDEFDILPGLADLR